MIYYLDRASNEIKLATSRRRHDVHHARESVITPSLPRGKYPGCRMSYACRRANGEYVIFYHGYYNNMRNAVALVATANSARGPIHEEEPSLRDLMVLHRRFLQTVSMQPPP